MKYLILSNTINARNLPWLMIQAFILAISFCSAMEEKKFGLLIFLFLLFNLFFLPTTCSMIAIKSLFKLSRTLFFGMASAIQMISITPLFLQRFTEDSDMNWSMALILLCAIQLTGILILIKPTRDRYVPVIVIILANILQIIFYSYLPS